MTKPLTLLALSSALTGCFFESDSGGGFRNASGFLVVDWSISGGQDPALCRQADVDVINIAVETARGRFLGEFEQFCEAFSTSIELERGGYFADAVLLDPAGFERTTSVDLGFFEIFGNDELFVPIDFPADSFF